jgi:glycosyltransferase involved in cell wall biosynthesis
MELANLAPTSLKVDALIAPSYFALYHPSVQTQVQAKHQYVLFTGIDHHVFVPSINTISKATVIIGYVGRLATEKSLGLLIEAAKHLSNSICSMYQCKFRIIGDGKLRHSLQELVHDWSLENMVELLPGIYNENMLVKELQKMDIYVNARFLETLGISPLEAMAVGIPVIGFGSGGMSQYMRDGFNSVVVKEPTPEAFANAIAYLIQNPDKRFYLGYNARKTVKDFFSLNDRLKQYSQIYKRLGKKTQVL